MDGLQSSSVYTCPYCMRSFGKESTQKRHYYYCRSKQRGPGTSRKRSCLQCTRAKTRCDSRRPRCSKCRDRRIDCEYQSSAIRDVRPPREEEEAASHNSVDSSSNGVDVSEAGASTDPTALVLSSPSPSAISDYCIGRVRGPIQCHAVGSQGFDFESLQHLDFNHVGPSPASYPSPHVSDTPFEIMSRTSPTPALVSSLRSFVPRTLAKTHSEISASLLARMLRSFPYMILRKETFPPFVNRQLYSWAESGEGQPLQSLINCISLVQMFKTRTRTNKKFVWRLIRLEHERIWREHGGFDRWELLAALQALLTYCLLRITEGECEENDFDAALLVSTNVIAVALAGQLGGLWVLTVPDDRQLEWEDWLFNESRRRTLLVFRIMNMLVDIDIAISCHGMSGFILVPLPANKTLWEATNADDWKIEFDLSYEERVIYGLSTKGDLIRFRQDSSGIESCVVDWEQWCSRVGDIGTLVMVAGSLL